MADAAMRVLDDETLRQKLRDNGRDLVARELTWDATARTYEEVYERLLARRAGRNG
jgi:glycosyltransferase involved in cell wall biosynthesis